jgi:hypothetical protein
MQRVYTGKQKEQKTRIKFGTYTQTIKFKHHEKRKSACENAHNLRYMPSIARTLRIMASPSSGRLSFLLPLPPPSSSVATTGGAVRCRTFIAYGPPHTRAVSPAHGIAHLAAAIGCEAADADEGCARPQ